MTTRDHDLVTIGAGSGGVRATRMAGGHGKRAAIVESGRVGGTCVMRGCVPKKLLVHGSHFAHDFEDAEGYGWSGARPVHDWPRMIAAKNGELDRLEGVYRRVLRDNNVRLLEGRGKLLDEHTVDVDGRTVTAEKILIATGGWPAMPDIPGIEYAITSNEALALTERPKRIAIVGGGYIAVEFAGIFNAFGSQVDLIIRAGNILRGFDEDVRATLAVEMEKKGIRIRRDETVLSIERKPGSGYSLRLGSGEALETDMAMYATGRLPNTKNLGLEEVGVEMGPKGEIIVNDDYQSSVPNIFALGDVIGRMALTPVAIAEAARFVETQFNDNPQRLDYSNVPTAVFSQPPVGVVGLSEENARRDFDIDVYVSSFKPMRHTLSGRDEKTMMKLVVDKVTDRVLGCHMVGADAPEIAQGLGIALKTGATKAQFDATIGIHPTAAEEFVTMRTKRPEH